MAHEKDPMTITQLVTALEEIQKIRNSEPLAEQVAIEWSQDRYGEKAIADALRSLGLFGRGDATDEEIIGNFESRVQDAPAQEPQMRENIARIGHFRNSQRLIHYARRELSTYSDALAFLGGDPSTDDQFLKSIYASKVSDNANDQIMAQQAVRIIAEHRNSDELKAFVTAGYQGDLKENIMDLNKAFDILGLVDQSTSAEVIWSVYSIRSADSPENSQRYRVAIETIARELNLFSLKEKLGISTQHADNETTKAQSFEPVGLHNIGNTCYLNSLLQSLFTIKPVREVVLNFDKYKQDLTKEEIDQKLVGQRHVDRREVIIAQNCKSDHSHFSNLSTN